MSWTSDVLRAGALLIGSGVLGVAINAISTRPVPLLASDGPGAIPRRAPRLTAPELREAWSVGRAVALIDVRSAESARSGRAPRAIQAPAKDFIDHYRRLRLDSILKAAEGVVVLCEGGDCAAGDRVAKVLGDLGHAEVRVLHRGWEGYVAAGLEVAP